jgi:general secretion pathway protein H
VKRRNDGFSLIEMMVVMALIALSVTLMTPSLSRVSRTVELKSAAKKVAAVLRYYRSEAVNRGKVYRVLFDSDATSVKVESVDFKEKKGENEPAVENDQKASAPTLMAYSLPRGVQMKELKLESPQYPSDVPAVEFYPNGGSNGGSILLESAELKGYKIKVHFLTGTVTIERG